MSAPVGVSMALTVKNERRLLRDNLLFHHYLGVDHFFVYDDGGTDASLESISDLSFVTPLPGVDRRLYESDPTCRDHIERFDYIYVARQLLNARNALDRARERGDAWLIMLDPDELICPDPDSLAQGALKQLLASVDPSVEQVVFTIAEIVQNRMAFDDVFAQAETFKLLGRQGAGLWTWRVNFLRFLLGFPHPLSRTGYNPDTNSEFPMGHIYGQVMGKSAVRLHPDIVPTDHTHWFRSRSKKQLKSLEHGHLLHYYCFDYEDFVESYRQIPDHPNAWRPGDPPRVEIQKRVWRDIVNHRGWTEGQLREYFARWILVPDDEIRRWLAMKPPAAMVVPAVRRVFEQLRNQTGRT